MFGYFHPLSYSKVQLCSQINSGINLDLSKQSETDHTNQVKHYKSMVHFSFKSDSILNNIIMPLSEE